MAEEQIIEGAEAETSTESHEQAKEKRIDINTPVGKVLARRQMVLTSRVLLKRSERELARMENDLKRNHPDEHLKYLAEEIKIRAEEETIIRHEREKNIT